MELNPGYKQSEIGVLPEDWEVKPLGELFEFSNGFNASSECYGKGIPFISTLDVLNFTHIHYADIIGKVLLEKGSESTYLVKKGDILFTRTSETQEEVGLTSVYMDDAPVTFGGFIIRGRQKQPYFDESFLGYTFRSPLVRKQIISLGQGGIHVNIGQTELQKVYIPIPPITEQKAIAAALSDVDALLSSLDALIAKKRDMKKAAMQELLTGKTRLPGFDGEWEEKTIASIATIVGGGTPSTLESSYWNGTISWFTPAEINGSRKFVEQSERRITEEGLKNSSAKLLPVGTILLTTRASIGLRAILSVPAATNQGFQNLVVNSDVSNQFIYYLLEIIQPELVKVASGSTFLEISPRKLGEIGLRLPSSLFEQQAIAEILSDMDAELEALEARYAKVKDIKTGMMQELLTGKTRLVPIGEQHG